MTLTGGDLLEQTVRRVADVIPPEAVHRGWNVKDLTLEYTEHGEQWSVDLVGPADVDVQRLSYSGQRSPHYLMAVNQGSHGTIETDSADALVDLVRQWMTILGFARGE